MHWRYAWLLVLALILTCTAHVVQITDENFGSAVNPADEWVLEFYAHWCGHCKHFEPKFHAAERIMSSSTFKNVHFGQVDTDANPALAARFFVSRLPTVVHIKDRQVREVAKRDVNSLVAFLEKEEWRQVNPVRGIISPFSLFGSIVGFIGKTTKALTRMSPWGIVGLLGGLLIFTYVLTTRTSLVDLADTTSTAPDNDIPTDKTTKADTTATPRVTRARARQAAVAGGAVDDQNDS